MSGSLSAAQVRTGYTAAVGQELGELFHSISSELTWIHWRWKQYRTLFGEKQSRIDLLNEAAPFFFHIVHNVLFEDTLLAIARLVGPPKSLNKPNLTVERFPPLLADVTLRNEICALVQKAKISAEFAVDWRNRRLAHRDLDLILSRSQLPLTPATREQVEVTLSALRDVLGRIEMECCNAATVYDSPAPGDAEALLYVIRDGLLRDRDRRERRKRRELHDEDIGPPEAL
jgi:hypothetical protein